MYLAAKDNPFTVQLTTSLPYRLIEGNWDLHLRRLRTFNHRASVVGPRGTGKSTLLKDLANKLLENSCRCFELFLPHEKQFHDEMLREARQLSKQGSVILVDGMERLSLPQRLRLLRCNKIVATSHRPIRFPLFGLPIWIRTTTNLDILRDILSSLEIHPREIIIERAEQLFEKYRGNVREVLRELYDLKASGQI